MKRHSKSYEFQYRKRYGLHAMILLDAKPIDVKFQYRKRYGLHAMKTGRKLSEQTLKVSIPQAVWIACN